MASQGKANTSPVASSTKSSLFNTLSPTSKKQSNSPWVDLFSKLANNSKLISDKYKKYFENNLYLYCSIGDNKLDFCPKKQTIVTPKGYNTLVTADSLTAAFKKLLEK